VGFILRRSELVRRELHHVPLDSLGADTQGAIGYMIQQSPANEFRRRGMNRQALTGHTGRSGRRQPGGRDEWTIAEEVGQGWRRVVPSPEPLGNIELDAVRHLMEGGYVVTAVGGGGIPVTRDAAGDLTGVEAVIDKDLASALRARLLGADPFVIATNVHQVLLELRDAGPARARPRDRRRGKAANLAEEHFGAGSMASKIQAIIRFRESGGRRAIVTRPPDLEDAVAGNAGTAFVAP